MKAKPLAALGGCLLLAGLVVGLVPVSSGGTSCGSAMVPEGLSLALTEGQRVANSCDSLLSVVAVPMWVLVALGGLLLLGAGLRAGFAGD